MIVMPPRLKRVAINVGFCQFLGTNIQLFTWLDVGGLQSIPKSDTLH